MKQSMFLVVALFLSSLALSGDQETQKGILSDTACSKHANDPEKTSNHTKMCAQMESCKASGYGLIMEGRFLKFDKAGDEMALAFLETTKKEAHLSIIVTADFSTDPIAVSKIEDAPREGSGPPIN